MLVYVKFINAYYIRSKTKTVFNIELNNVNIELNNVNIENIMSI